MFDVIAYIFLFGIGVAVGSFVNVAVLRFGFRESPQARSHCMACTKQIRSYDLIPVVSYFVLKGKCRSCGSALIPQYPLVELAVGFLFVLAYTTVPPIMALWSLLAFISLLLFLSALIALVVYDFRHTLIPLPFAYTLIASALVASVFQSLSAHSLQPLYDAFLGAVTLSGFFLAIYLFTHGKGMGLGDAYVAGAVGLLLGLVRGIESVMLAMWSGTVFYLGIMMVTSLMNVFRSVRHSPRAISLKTEVPFVPFLALGVLLALFSDISPLSFGTWIAQIFAP